MTFTKKKYVKCWCAIFVQAMLFYTELRTRFARYSSFNILFHRNFSTSNLNFFLTFAVRNSSGILMLVQSLIFLLQDFFFLPKPILPCTLLCLMVLSSVYFSPLSMCSRQAVFLSSIIPFSAFSLLYLVDTSTIFLESVIS